MTTNTLSDELVETPSLADIARKVAASFLDPTIAGGTIAMMAAGKMDDHVWVRIARAALEASGIERIQEEARKLREALEKIAIPDLHPGLFEQLSAGHRSCITFARTALSADMGEDQ